MCQQRIVRVCERFIHRVDLCLCCGDRFRRICIQIQRIDLIDQCLQAALIRIRNKRIVSQAIAQLVHDLIRICASSGNIARDVDRQLSGSAKGAQDHFYASRQVRAECRGRADGSAAK